MCEETKFKNAWNELYKCFSERMQQEEIDLMDSIISKIEDDDKDYVVLECNKCGWIGTSIEANHTFASYSLDEEDTSPSELSCPKCGSNDLIESYFTDLIDEN